MTNPKSNSENFFEFIVISHCFFFEPDQRLKSCKTFREVFTKCLINKGYVLLFVQGRKLFKAYNARQTEDSNHETLVVIRFIEELGLNLEWYKYVTSTGRRTPIGSEFARFAEENLPQQMQMSKLKRHYLGQHYNSTYALDDYIILAKK